MLRLLYKPGALVDELLSSIPSRAVVIAALGSLMLFTAGFGTVLVLKLLSLSEFGSSGFLRASAILGLLFSPLIAVGEWAVFVGLCYVFGGFVSRKSFPFMSFMRVGAVLWIPIVLGTAIVDLMSSADLLVMVTNVGGFLSDITARSTSSSLLYAANLVSLVFAFWSMVLFAEALNRIFGMSLFMRWLTLAIPFLLIFGYSLWGVFIPP